MNALRVSLLLVLLAGSLAACSVTEPREDLRDGLSDVLSQLLVEVPAFGGVTYDDNERLVVYTLGEAPEAAAEIRNRIGALLATSDDPPDPGVEIRQRPARGNATAALRDRIDPPLADTVVLDAETGYVRVGVWTDYAARTVIFELREADIPLTDVIVQVQDRP